MTTNLRDGALAAGSSPGGILEFAMLYMEMLSFGCRLLNALSRYTRVPSTANLADDMLPDWYLKAMGRSMSGAR